MLSCEQWLSHIQFDHIKSDLEINGIVSDFYSWDCNVFGGEDERMLYIHSCEIKLACYSSTYPSSEYFSKKEDGKNVC